jgi:hypothetical protein
MPVFKRKGKLFTGPARPHALALDAILAERPGQMVKWIRENPPAKLEGLWQAMLPEGSTAPPQGYAADLFWLLQQGHILLYTDDTLVVQDPPKPQEPKKPKQPKKKAVAEKPAEPKPSHEEASSEAPEAASEAENSSAPPAGSEAAPEMQAASEEPAPEHTDPEKAPVGNETAPEPTEESIESQVPTPEPSEIVPQEEPAKDPLP